MLFLSGNVQASIFNGYIEVFFGKSGSGKSFTAFSILDVLGVYPGIVGGEIWLEIDSKRQNLLETIRGGKPDRFVNQYEAFDCSPSSPTAYPLPPVAPVTDIFPVVSVGIMLSTEIASEAIVSVWPESSVTVIVKV